MALLQKLYDAFDESGDDEEEQSDEDDHDPRQGVDNWGRLGEMWTRRNFAAGANVDAAISA